MKNSLPEHEVQRLQALFSYGILDTPTEEMFDNLVRLTSQINQTPIAALCFLDSHRCWYKAHVGLPSLDCSRPVSFAEANLLKSSPLVISDVQADPRFSDNPFAQAQPPIRFYAGVPLFDPMGHSLGALEIMDYLPRQPTPQQLEILVSLGRQAMALLQSRQKLIVASEAIANSVPITDSLSPTAENHSSPFARKLYLTLSQLRLQVVEKQQQEQLALQNLALEAARQQAEQESRMKSAFLSIMSHEIRTPMNAVLGVTDLLNNTNLDEEQKELLRIIRTGTNSLLTLINDVLDFSKLESGEVQLEQLNFDLRVCIEDALDLLAAIAYAKGLEVAAIIHPDIPTQLIGDVTRLRQILINLIGNAIKFTQVGEVVVRTTVKSETDTAIELEFSVTDTGIGISPEVQSKLFQPYSQTHSSITRNYGGTGLGLAICKQLVELMGGQIWVKSDGIQGTQFAFTLTFTKQVAQPATLPSTMLLKGWKGLLVSPKAIHQEIIRQMTASCQMTIETAETDIAALSLLQANPGQSSPYRVVLLDDALPTEMVNNLLCHLFSKTASSFPHLILLRSPATQHQEPSAILPVAVELPKTTKLTTLPKPLKLTRLLDCLTAVLTSPAELSSLPQLQEKTRATTQSIQPPLPTSSLKILVVEDTPVNQAVMLRLLKSLGYLADLAEHGQEALERTAQTSYDLILMDCQLPIMNGYEATRQIRSRAAEQGNPWASSMPVIIAMTANAMLGDREKCLAVGMNDYMSKPITREDLAAKLAHWEKQINQYQDEQNLIADEQTLTENQPEIAMTDSITLATDVVPPSVIDWPYLLKLAEGDRSFALELLTLFLDDHFSELNKLKCSLQEQNFQQLKTTAHKFKGASTNLGLQGIQELVIDIETKALAQQLADLPQLLAQLEALLQQIQSFILSMEPPT